MLAQFVEMQIIEQFYFENFVVWNFFLYVMSIGTMLMGY